MVLQYLGYDSKILANKKHLVEFNWPHVFVLFKVIDTTYVNPGMENGWSLLHALLSFQTDNKKSQLLKAYLKMEVWEKASLTILPKL